MAQRPGRYPYRLWGPISPLHPPNRPATWNPAPATAGSASIPMSRGMREGSCGYHRGTWRDHIPDSEQAGPARVLSPQSLGAPRTSLLSVHLLLLHHVHLPRALADTVPSSWNTVPHILRSQRKHTPPITLTRSILSYAPAVPYIHYCRTLVSALGTQ